MCCKPLGGESSVVLPASVQTVLPVTFVQRKLLPAIFVYTKMLPATLARLSVLYAPGGEHACAHNEADRRLDGSAADDLLVDESGVGDLRGTNVVPRPSCRRECCMPLGGNACAHNEADRR